MISTYYTCSNDVTSVVGSWISYDYGPCQEIALVKTNALSSIYPHTADKKACTLLLLTNLAEPEWVYVDCYRTVLTDVCCVVEDEEKLNQEDDNKLASTKNAKLYKPTCIIANLNCYIFKWIESQDSRKKLVGHSDTCSHLKSLQHIFPMKSAKFPPVLGNTCKDMGDRIKTSGNSGFHIVMEKERPRVIGSQIFSCSNGGYVSFLHVCDDTTDCPNGRSDESDCVCKNISDRSASTCRHVVLGPHRKQCGSLYYMSVNGHCYSYASTQKNDAAPAHNLSHCASSKMLNVENDLFADCGPGAEDEPLLKEFLTKGATSSCLRPYEIPCKQGQSHCFNITDVCIYKLNEYKHILPCRTGGHLENCREFQCNMKFKCRNSYCTPWSNVCDGKWDCPWGQDEKYKDICQKKPTCLGMYKCRLADHMCLHLGNLCDSLKDCPYNDDEYLCELKAFECWRNCFCLIFAMECINISLEQEKKSLPFWSVSLMKTKLAFQTILTIFINVTHLKLHDNGITVRCNHSFPGNLFFLDIGFNEFSRISKHCFTIKKLKILIIDNNNIKVVEASAFSKLEQLKMLSLSHNFISILEENTFGPGSQLKILSLREIDFIHISTNAFGSVKPDLINTTDYHICCIAPSTSHCTAEKPWFVACDDLLPDKSMRPLFISISSLVLSFNIISFVIHVILEKSNKPFLLTVLSINITDVLCAFYLGVIWTADLYFAGIFLVREELWRSSPFCLVAFFIVLWQNVLSQATLVYLSLSRLMVVMQPVDTIFKSTKFVLKCESGMFAISSLFCCTKTLAVKFIVGILPLSLCSPFVDPSKSEIIITILTCVIAVSQLVSAVSILVMYVLLVHKMIQSTKEVRMPKGKEDHTVALVIQLVIITASNILCWFPANSIYISALILSKYPTDLVIWTTVGAMPINSLINPAVFTVTCLRKSVKARRKANPQNCEVKQNPNIVHGQM